MNDHQLNKLLLSWRVPERPEEYWAEFPNRVLARLRSQPPPQPRLTILQRLYHKLRRLWKA